MSNEGSQKFIIKFVFRNIQNALFTASQLASIHGGEIRSLYLSPVKKNGEREMIMEYEGKIDSANYIMKTVMNNKECIKVVVVEFPAALIRTNEEVY